MNDLSLTTFPYRKSPVDEDEYYYPIIPVTLFYKRTIADTSALIDSGATISVFRPEIAEQLGVEIEKGKELSLRGVASRIKGYVHKLKFEVAGRRFSSEVVFSYEFLASFNLLGRDSFFKHFLVTFSEKKRLVELK